MTSTIVLVVFLAAAVYVVWTYNQLIKLRNLKSEAWSGIDVQLKRRHDLIPNLVEVVKGYSTHERETLEEVTRLRTESRETDDLKQKGELERTISQDIKKIFALVEQYPDLKANESFLELQSNLTEIEDQLQFARRYYNGSVRNLNILVESVPSNLIANVSGVEAAEFFEIEYATERANPDVDL